MAASSDVWLIRCGEGGTAVDACVSNGLMAVRFSAVGDVRELSYEQVLAELRGTSEKPGFEEQARDLLAFAQDIAVGDIAITSDKVRRRFILGNITGHYRWTVETPVPGMRHVREVNWRNFLDWDEAPEGLDTLKSNQSWVQRITDPLVHEVCEDLVQATVPVKKLLTKVKRTKPLSAAAQKNAGAQAERTCASCGLRKNPSQFTGGSALCVDCE